MYNIQKYKVAKDSQCLKGSDSSLHDRWDRAPDTLHREGREPDVSGAELHTKGVNRHWFRPNDNSQIRGQILLKTSTDRSRHGAISLA